MKQTAALVRFFVVFSLGIAAGCVDDVSVADASMVQDDAALLDGGSADGTTSNPEDGSVLRDASADAPPISTGDGSVASAAAEVVRTGSGGFLLRGTVLTPTGVIDPGEVLVVGNMITCVAANCSGTTGASTVTVIETHGVISPGLIDAHNHLAYDIFDEWIPPMLYGNRYEWADDSSYEDFIAPYADHRSTGTTYCPCAKWGELRSIVHGTTTVQGQSFQQACVNSFVRNADHYDGIGYEQLSTNIGSVRDLNDSQATTLINKFTASSEPLLRYAVHMAEGITSPTTLEFESFAGRDTRSNRHMGTSLLSGSGFSGTAVLIHSIPLTESQLMEAADAHAKFVWSPSSNIVLYGQTADIARWISLDLTIGLGPDWTLSGEDDMLGELRFARNYGREMSIASLTTQRLWQMATQGSAEVLGVAPNVGRLVVGSLADITVIGRSGGDPYGAVIDANARDVRMTMVDGKVYYGDASLESAAALNGTCDTIEACGVSKFLCVKGVPGTTSGTPSRTDETLEDVQAQLLTILDGYGRSDLLPLVSECR